MVEMIDGGAGSDEREEEYDRRVVSFGLNVRNLSERKRKKQNTERAVMNEVVPSS